MHLSCKEIYHYPDKLCIQFNSTFTNRSIPFCLAYQSKKRSRLTKQDVIQPELLFITLVMWAITEPLYFAVRAMQTFWEALEKRWFELVRSLLEEIRVFPKDDPIHLGHFCGKVKMRHECTIIKHSSKTLIFCLTHSKVAKNAEAD